ncbi:MAG: hypothetical protein O7E54_13700 [Planctomycetota bacterium]|nr:hypothetical protein [Planctomycetota bacterium]
MDTSLSSHAEPFRRWLSLLRGVLERNRDTLKEFGVVFFNIEAFRWREGFVANTPENVAALLRDAGRLVLEGATDLEGALREALRLAAEPCDLFLLSDGVATVGAADPYALSQPLADRGIPLFAYGARGAIVAHLARETGGAVFGTADLAGAATAHRTRPWRIERVEADGGRDLLLAGRPRHVYPGQTLTIAGRGSPESVTLVLEQDGRRRRIHVLPTRRVDTPLARRVYGQIAVAQLEALGPAATLHAREYATHFRVVGASCSLLMLETEADYERFGFRAKQSKEFVEECPAGAHVARAIVRRRGGAKERFLAWVERLGSLPGVGMRLPEGAVELMRRLSPAAFDLPASALSCSAREGGVVSDPDAVRREAKGRLHPADALRAFSSLVELDPGDPGAAREVAYEAMERKFFGFAYRLLQHVARIRPDQPDTYLLMATCLDRLGCADLALLHHELAVGGDWDARYGDCKLIARHEYARFLRGKTGAFAAGRLPELDVAERPDLYVLVRWNTDRTDVDLHVTDAAGETCSYNHRDTAMGGRITRDVTGGFGPELFVLPKAKRGAYKIKLHFYGADQVRLSSRTKAYVTVRPAWGVSQTRVVELERKQPWYQLAEIHR